MSVRKNCCYCGEFSQVNEEDFCENCERYHNGDLAIGLFDTDKYNKEDMAEILFALVESLDKQIFKCPDEYGNVHFEVRDKK